MNIKITRRSGIFAGLTGLLVAMTAWSQTATNAFRPELLYRPHGNFEGQTARPLRYWPIGGDFVITNGAEFFNRPLYCMNSPFRIDAGDKPEFSIYAPGRGGNLRLGIKKADGVKWLNDAERIVTHYRPGSMIYQISDPLLAEGELVLTALPLSAAKGLIVFAELRGKVDGVELVMAFGGANGMKGQRSGDIGCEREPVSQFFQLRPEQCRSDIISITENGFTLHNAKITMSGVTPAGMKLSVADATKWNSPSDLLGSAGKETTLPVITGEVAIAPGQPAYLALQQLGAGGQEDSAVYKEVSQGAGGVPASEADKPVSAYKISDLPKVFVAAEEHRRSIAERVVIETPDPFINAAAGALNIAANAVWDEKQQSFMHGAVAWRTRLLGWRGSYTGDALGWHERTAAHFAGFARQQNTSAIPEKIPPADEQFNLARSEAAIHSNGDLSKNHYDMNLVGVDAFFRHLLWRGDLDYAREMWPVIERHLAWERRLFRREFGPDKLPLYEAYAAIWASDDMNYNGGGVTHATAYNYWHNTMAARVAKLLGQDPSPYQQEADLIRRGIEKYLWLADEGNFAECRDYLGRQLAHPSAGLWTFYHTLDSEVPTPAEAAQMARWVDLHIAHIPVQGAGVPDENLFTLPETSWMPYQWSLNNVVMAEATHTALGFWQANRAETACQLYKGELMDSMFLGLCPGNLGCMTAFDMARGEAQRDFADACGINARALVEGLFGVKPDALAGELKIAPGFPAKWEQASMRHPDFNFSFRRTGATETYLIEPKFSRPMKLRLQVAALRDDVAGVTVNGQPAKWRRVDGADNQSRIEIVTPAAEKFEVVVAWKGEVVHARAFPVWHIEREQPSAMDWKQRLPDGVKLETIDLAAAFNDKVGQIFRNQYRSPRSPFASLALPKQGLSGWCEPNASFDVDDAGLRQVAARHDGKIILPNGVPLQTPGAPDVKNIIFTSQWDNYPHEVSVPLAGKAAHAYLLMAGSTEGMQSQFDNGEVLATYGDGTTARLALRNPTTWWPIDQDYFIDDYAFRYEGSLPPRVDLRTGNVRVLEMKSFKGKGGTVRGGAATVLDLPLDKTKELKSLTVRALANEVVIGLMSVTLER